MPAALNRVVHAERAAPACDEMASDESDRDRGQRGGTKPLDEPDDEQEPGILCDAVSRARSMHERARALTLNETASRVRNSSFRLFAAFD